MPSFQDNTTLDSEVGSDDQVIHTIAKKQKENYKIRKTAKRHTRTVINYVYFIHLRKQIRKRRTNIHEENQTPKRDNKVDCNDEVTHASAEKHTAKPRENYKIPDNPSKQTLKRKTNIHKENLMLKRRDTTLDKEVDCEDEVTHSIPEKQPEKPKVNYKIVVYPNQQTPKRKTNIHEEDLMLKRDDNILESSILPSLDYKFDCNAQVTRAIAEKQKEIPKENKIPNLRKQTLKENTDIAEENPILDRDGSTLDNGVDTNLSKSKHTIAKKPKENYKIPHHSRRHSRKRKTNIDEERRLLKKAYELLTDDTSSQSSESSTDRYFSYGQYIANELRKYDRRTLIYVKKAINNIIFKADLGKYRHHHHHHHHHSSSANLYPFRPTHSSHSSKSSSNLFSLKFLSQLLKWLSSQPSALSKSSVPSLSASASPTDEDFGMDHDSNCDLGSKVDSDSNLDLGSKVDPGSNLDLGSNIFKRT